MKRLKPSDFTKKIPMGSVEQEFNTELIALNIMKILKRTGDTFRELGFEEYKIEREKDGEFTFSEKQYFLRAVGHCSSSVKALNFCPNWLKV